MKFFEIVRNKSLTIAQQKHEVRKWAEKYRILGKVQAFNKEKEERINAMKANVAKLIQELPIAMQKHSALMENDNQTPMERRAAVERLHSENPQLYRVLAFAVKQFLPRHPPNSLPGAPVPGFPGGQGGFPGGQGGFPEGPVGFPGGQGGSTGSQGGFPWGQGGFPGGQEGFPWGQGGFPGGQGGFPWGQGGLPGGNEGFPGGQGGFPWGQGGFPGGPGGFPGRPGCPGGPGGFPGRPGGIPGGPGGCPGGRGGFPRRHEGFDRFGNDGFNGGPQFPRNQEWQGMNDGRFPHHGRVRA
ncbi:hypothetical protein ANCDUO_20773 [Ancylostoma duodenale]|uniref:SXP/RAL-2 family protein Ani s 5-like cation-binding domain-containing protein n=1 Tax=Ancylostoma duodenale TaxID=51022 RepID=A0A0C2BYY4_9BILA|nr:hypothetical protein ANCDUO_20773 [Ancylostoma duodenale]